MNMLRSILVALTALVLAGQAHAHQTSLSQIIVTEDENGLGATITSAFLDLEVAVGVDQDFDGQITWGEAKAGLDRISAYLLARTSLSTGGACRLTRRSANPVVQNGEGYLSIGFDADCPRSGVPVDVTSSIFLEIDPTSRVLVSARTGGASRSYVLGIEDQPATTEPAPAEPGEGSFLSYFAEGISHLFGGPDHLVFLLVLIIPAIYAGGGARGVALAVLLPITGFTIGHALTLTSAASGLIRPPTQIVESLIAFTILLTAIDNVRRFIPGPRSVVAFIFGLIHGFGFASALGTLDISGWDMAVALLGFNLGIEAGQVVLALIAAPLLFLVREPARRLHAMPLGVSVLAGAMAVFWIVERTILA